MQTIFSSPPFLAVLAAAVSIALLVAIELKPSAAEGESMSSANVTAMSAQAAGATILPTSAP